MKFIVTTRFDNKTYYWEDKLGCWFQLASWATKMSQQEARATGHSLDYKNRFGTLCGVEPV